MSALLHIDIVSAEQSLFSGTASFVRAPAEQGEMGVLPHHTPLLTRLRPGEIMLRLPDGEEQYFYVSGGLMEVQPQVVTVLADTALRARDIDEAAAQQARERAESALKDQHTAIDYAHAQAELAEAIAQLKALQSLRKKTRT
jgi:F-type H+-transporting ATPase subunit epsilon